MAKALKRYDLVRAKMPIINNSEDPAMLLTTPENPWGVVNDVGFVNDAISVVFSASGMEMVIPRNVVDRYEGQTITTRKMNEEAKKLLQKKE